MPEEPAPGALLTAIAGYALSHAIDSPLANDTAVHCLMDALACGFLALKHPACTRLLGPVVPGATLTGGARVPGTSYELDPITAAFDIGTMVRWVDSNDSWLAAEWGRPSDNVGAILAVADYLSRSGKPVAVRDVLTAMIKAYEIQGVLALEYGRGRAVLDHLLRVRVASTAVATVLLGGTPERVRAAVSYAWIDGGSLRGDATSRAVQLALLVLKGEMNEIGHPVASTLTLSQPFGCRMMEKIGQRLIESMPVLVKRFEASVAAHFKPKQAAAIGEMFADRTALSDLPVSNFVAKLVRAS